MNMDPIADMLTQIRNRQMAKKTHVTVDASTFKEAIVKVLEKEGYITGYTRSADKKKPTLEIELKYYKGKPVIERIQRISRCSLKVSKKKDAYQDVLRGIYGILVVSTSKGVMSHREAKQQGLGGEVICLVA